MGNLYKGPERKLTPAAFQVRNIAAVGGYAIQPIWGDGHASGPIPVCLPEADRRFQGVIPADVFDSNSPLESAGGGSILFLDVI